ncbi:hypothetical protein ACFE04_031707 [Oxalis oulophora]
MGLIVSGAIMYAKSSVKLLCEKQNRKLSSTSIPSSLPAARQAGGVQVGGGQADFNLFFLSLIHGALDGGLDIPHNEKRFAGYTKESKQLDAEVHRKYVFGGHVAAYMTTLMEDEPEKYQSHFSEYIKRGITPDTMEELYKKVHANIRADPIRKKVAKPAPKERKRFNLMKLTYEERRAKLIERLNSLNDVANEEDDE